MAEVWDEPFYAAYLALTGKDHPMRAEVLAAQPQDWRAVAQTCATAPVPAGKLLYQKHMTHHMLPEIDRGWLFGLTNVFLIRAPERVVASYAARREQVTLEDIGFLQQAELFELVAERTGRTPPVIDAERVRADPEGVLRRLTPGDWHRLRSGHARLAGRSARQRRRLGAALVCLGERLDRLRPARATSAIADRRHGRNRRGGAPCLRKVAASGIVINL